MRGRRAPDLGYQEVPRDADDTQADQLMHELYGLTEEEIKIVEGQ